jgi:phosphopantothenoylcysteine synthetase/decarboxylase
VAVSVVVSDAGLQWSPITTSPERPRPERVVVCPLTFNTANKAAAGIMDSLAAGVLCDAIGAAVPIVAVPMVSSRLWGHPAWPNTLRALAGAGVRLVDPRSGGEPGPVPSGTGLEVVAAFDPRWAAEAVAPAA